MFFVQCLTVIGCHNAHLQESYGFQYRSLSLISVHWPPLSPIGLA